MKHLINKFLKPMNVELHGKGYLQKLAKGEFKKNEFDFQKEYFKGRKVRTIFDIGANIGHMAEIMRGYFPDAVIHAFEPFPDSFEKLQTTASSLKNVVVNELAIGAEKSTTTFFVNAKVDTNSLLAPQKTGLSSDKHCENVKNINVKVDTIDNYCQQNNIDKIEILKLDIQGGEIGALKGAAEALEDGKIELIYTEAYFIQQYKDQPRFHDLCTYLFNFGFKLQDIYNPIYGNNCLAWCDAIFIKA